MQWVLKITTIDGRDYLIEASDQATREEWRAAIEERIRLLDPSKLQLKKKPLTLTRSITGRGNNEEDLAQERLVQHMYAHSCITLTLLSIETLWWLCRTVQLELLYRNSEEEKEARRLSDISLVGHHTHTHT